MNGPPQMDEGGPGDSPLLQALCYSPFASPSSCPTPDPATLATALPLVIDMQGLLSLAAVGPFSANPDAIFSHGKNFYFMDYLAGRLRLYLPWDLDSALSGGGVNHNVYAPPLAADPNNQLGNQSVAEFFAARRAWLSERLQVVSSQIEDFVPCDQTVDVGHLPSGEQQELQVLRVVQSGSTTDIYYTTGLAKNSVPLTIYDVLGRRVRTFERGEPSGNDFMVSWDRRDQRGLLVSRGIYFADLRTESTRASRKFAITR